METPKDIHMATHNLVKAVGKKYANTGKIPVSEFDYHILCDTVTIVIVTMVINCY